MKYNIYIFQLISKTGKSEAKTGFIPETAQLAVPHPVEHHRQA